MSFFTLLFLGMLLFSIGLDFWLDHRQQQHVLRHRAAVPAAFAGQIPLADHQKAADYTVAKLKLGRWDRAIELALLLLMTLGGGLQWLHAQLGSIASPVGQGVALMLSFMLITSLVGLPMGICRTFGVERRFGFSTITPQLFALDFVKSTLLTLAIGTPFLWLVLWLFGSMGDYWWVWVWTAVISFQLIALVIYPLWIAPLFNRFSPLADEALKTRIESLLTRCGFTSNGVFIMDGSKRSRHGNAYFSGLGRMKRIVFFDTLMAKLQPQEIEAVLAHELGHFRHGHIKKRLWLMSALMLAALFGLSRLYAWPGFFTGLGVTDPAAHTPAMALLLFMLVLPVFLAVLAPLFKQLSRRDEFEADRFAAQHTQAADLTSALVKLYQDNAATLTPDPLYSAYHDSHPPAPVRIAALNALESPT